MAWRRSWLTLGLLLALCAMATELHAGKYKTPGPNKPDQKVNLLGEFVWANANGPELEDMQVVGPPDGAHPFGTEANGKLTDQRHLLFRFQRGGALKRVNLTSQRTDIAHMVQFKRFWLETTGAHNSKIMLGYMPTDWRFTHGDNADLVHWALAPRVVLFIPVRHAMGADPEKPESYFISPYGGQTISVVEFKPGELIDYGWYRGGPGRLDRHVLFDLYPHCGGEKDLKPGLNQPMFKFEVFPKGGWKVSIERDGRDGLAGGEKDGEFDLVFTNESKGAKPYTVKLGEKNAFGLSVYCPSGSPNWGAKILLKTEAFDRQSGRALDTQPRRDLILRDVTLEELPDKLRAIQAASGEGQREPGAEDLARLATGIPSEVRAALARTGRSTGQPVTNASPDNAPPVKIRDANGRVNLENGLVSVDIAPARGMYVTRAVDLTTKQTIVTDLKLNFPYFEHGIKQNQSSGYRVLHNNDGSVTVAMNMRFGHHKGRKEVQRYGRFGERILSEFVTVRPGSAALDFRGRVDNPTPLRRSNRLWDRALMPVDEHTHFIMPASHGVEHAANWIKPWPEWEVTLADGSKRQVDFRLARNWKMAGVRLPTQYFALNQIWPFSGVYHEKTDINRIRISNRLVDPGVKIYYGGAFELWGGTTPIFEDPGTFLGGYEPVEYTKQFWIASGIGRIDFANQYIAIHAETGRKPVVRVTSSRLTPNARVVVGLPRVKTVEVLEERREEHGPPLLHAIGAERRVVLEPLAEARGDIGPGQVVTVELEKPQDAFVVGVYDQRGILQSGDPYWARYGLPEPIWEAIGEEGAAFDSREIYARSSVGVAFPLTVPDRSADYEAAKQACSRSRTHWVELQEHANHTGIETALSATGHAKRLLNEEKPELERLVSLANACYRIGDFEHASALAKRVLERSPREPHAHHVLGMIAYEQGGENRETVLAHLSQAGPQANYVRALMHMQAGDTDEAVKLLRQMIDARSTVYRPRMLLAVLLAKQDKHEAALELARDLVAENPASPEALETLHRVARASKDEALAGHAAAERDKLLAGNPDADRQMGLFRGELDHGRWVYPSRYRFDLPQLIP